MAVTTRGSAARRHLRSAHRSARRSTRFSFSKFLSIIALSASLVLSLGPVNLLAQTAPQLSTGGTILDWDGLSPSDGNNNIDNQTTLGGTGTWNTTTSNWWNSSAGGADIAWNNAGLNSTNPDIARFGGVQTTSTVTLGGPITAGGLVVDTGGYTFAGTSTPTLTLSNGTASPVDVVFNVSTTLNNTFKIAATNGVRFLGSHTGSSTINADVSGLNGGITIISTGSGRIDFAGQAAAAWTSSAFNLYGGNTGFLNNGTASNQSISYGNNINVFGNAGIFVDRVSANTANTIVFNNLNLNSATLSVSNTAANNYGVQFTGTTTLASAMSSISSSINPAGGAQTNPTASMVALNYVTGSGALNKLGTGTVTLFTQSGTPNTYTGGTNIMAGTLLLSTSSATASSGNIIVNPAGTFAVSNAANLVPASNQKLYISSATNSLGFFRADADSAISDVFAASSSLLNNAVVGVYGASALLNSTSYTAAGLSQSTGGSGTYAGTIEVSNLGAAASRNVSYGTFFLGTAATTNMTGMITNAGGDGALRLGTGGGTLNLNQSYQIGNNQSTSFTGNVIIGSPFNNGQAMTGSTGTVAARATNNLSGGTITVNKGSTLSVTNPVSAAASPLGSDRIDLIGAGATFTTGTTAADGTAFGSIAGTPQLGNTTFNVFQGAVLTFDESTFTGSSTDFRVSSNSANLFLNSGTFNFNGANAAGLTTSQGFTSVNVGGGNTIQVLAGTGTNADTTLTIAALNRIGNATIGFTRTAGSTFGTSSATTSDPIVTITNFNGTGTTPAITNGMIAPWMIDATGVTFLTYNTTTSSIAPAAFTDTNFAAPGATKLEDVSTASSPAAASVYAMRIGNVALSGTNTLTISGNVTDGAGLLLNNSGSQTDTVNLKFGGGADTEALIYTSTSGVTTTLTGSITTLGLTKFGAGTLNLNPATNVVNAITGTITINAGTLQGSNVGLNWAPITLNAGTLDLTVTANGIYKNAVTVVGDSTMTGVAGNQNRISSLTISQRLNSGDVSGNAGNGNVTDAINLTLANSGISLDKGLTLNNALFLNATAGGTQSIFGNQLAFGSVQPALSGTKDLTKWGSGAIILATSSPAYSGNIIINGGTGNSTANLIRSQAGADGDKPFGTGAITVNPGGILGLANPKNISSNSSVTLNSDINGLASIELAYGGNIALPTGLTFNSGTYSAPFSAGLLLGAVGYSGTVNLNTFGNGLAFFGAAAITSNFTGTLLPSSQGLSKSLPSTVAGAPALDATNPVYRLVAGNGTLNLMLGTSNQLQANTDIQVGAISNVQEFTSVFLANGSGSVAIYNPNPNFNGNVVLNGATNNLNQGNLVIGNSNAIGTGTIIFNGGGIQVDANYGTLNGYLNADRVISNNIVFAGDAAFNGGTNLRIASPLSLTADVQSGVTRTLAVNNLTGLVVLSGKITDGPTGSSNNGINKTGTGVLQLANPQGNNSYSGFTTITAGSLLVNSDADVPAASQIVFNGGQLAVWNNSFTTTRSYIATATSSIFDIAPGKVLTQSDQSNISGNTTINKNGQGVLVLNAANSGNNATAVAVNGGILQVGADVNIGDPVTHGTIQLSGGTFRDTGSFTTTRALTGSTNPGGIDIVGAGTTLTLTGVVSGSTNIAKTGAGTLSLNTGADTETLLTVENGTILNSVSTAGTTLFGSAAVLYLNGGSLTVQETGAAARALTAQTVNAGGGGHLNLQTTNASGSVALTLTNITRNVAGTLVLDVPAGTLDATSGQFVQVKPTNLTLAATRFGTTNNTNTQILGINTADLAVGMTVIGTGVTAGTTIASINGPTSFTLSAAATATGTNAFMFTNPRAASVNNNIFAGSIITTDATGAANFLQNDNTNTSVAPWDLATGATATLSGSNPNLIGNISAVQTLSGVNSIYGLRTTASINAGAGGGTLKVTSVNNTIEGAVLVNDNVTIGANVIFDPTTALTTVSSGASGEGLLFVNAGKTATVNGNVTATSLTKFGGGTLLLNGSANGILNTLTVQEGTVKVAASSNFSKLQTDLVLNNQGTLDLNGSSQSFNSLSNSLGFTNNNGVLTTSLVAGGIITNNGGSAANLVINGAAGYVPGPGSLPRSAVTTNGNASITGLSSTADLYVGEVLTGTGMAAGAIITQINSATSITISQNATATGTATLSFSPIATPGGATASSPLARVGTPGQNNQIITGLTTTADLVIGMPVFGTNVAAGAVIQSIDSATQITLRAVGNNANVGAVPAMISFGQLFQGRITDGSSPLGITKSGLGTLALGGYTVLYPDANNNSFTGGVILNQGTLLVENPLGLGGANLDGSITGAGTTPGAVNLIGGTLDLRNSGGGINGTIILGNQTTNGVNVNVLGSATINVDRLTTIGNTGLTASGNAWQINNLNLSENILTTTGNSSFRLKVAGKTTIQGAYATVATGSSTQSGALELAGQVVDTSGTGGAAGVLIQRGSDASRTLIIDGNNNTYTGGTNLISGTIQVVQTTGTPLGTGPVQIFGGGGMLRLAGIGGLGNLSTNTLKVYGYYNNPGYVGLDEEYDPTTVLNSSKVSFTNVYNNLGVAITRPFYASTIDQSTIADGKSFLVNGLFAEADYVAGTLVPGLGDGLHNRVYRLAGGLGSNLAIVGPDNTLADYGTPTFLQIGSRLSIENNAAITGQGNAVIIRNSNSFTGGVQIGKGSTLQLDTGAAPLGSTPLGSADGTLTGGQTNVEVFGTIQTNGLTGSFFNAATGHNANSFTLRPGGTIIINDVAGDVPGGQGRWEDSAGININGGIFRFNGAAAYASAETIGTVTADKGSELFVNRSTTSGTAALFVNDIVRQYASGSTGNGTMILITSGTNTLGIPASTTVTNNTADAGGYDRVIVNNASSSAIKLGGSTNIGANVKAGIATAGMAPAWIINATDNSFVTYNPVSGLNSGYQSLVSVGSAGAGGVQANGTFTPGANQVGYSKVITTGLEGGANPISVSGTDIVDVTTAALTLGETNMTVYALRTSQNISASGANNQVTILGDADLTHPTAGLIFNGSPTIGVAPTLGVINMTLNFGANGAAEGIIDQANNTTTTINAKIVANNGLTFMSPRGANDSAVVLTADNAIGGPVTLNSGRINLQNTLSGTGVSATGVINGQNLIIGGFGTSVAANGGNRVILLGQVGTPNTSVLPSAVGTTTTFGTNSTTFYVNGDAQIDNNNTAFMQRIPNLTIATLGPSSPIHLLTQGITVTGTTTLGSYDNYIDAFFNGPRSTVLAGQVTGGTLTKFGNGDLLLANRGQNANNYTATVVNPAAVGVNTSAVGSLIRSGDPFGTGSITVNPGAALRIIDPSNISAQPVTLNSDGLGIAGIAIGYNATQAQLSGLFASTPTNGKITATTTGNYGAAILLDANSWTNRIDLAALETAVGNGKPVVLGSTMSITQTYFSVTNGGGVDYMASTLGVGSGNTYRLGAGGNVGVLSFGNGTFENVLGGSANVQIGMMTAAYSPDGPQYINGNGNVQLDTRNNFTGGITVHGSVASSNQGAPSSQLILGNAYAIGNNTLNVDNGIITLQNTLTLNNPINIVGDAIFINSGNFAGSDSTFAGNVNLAPNGIGGTRTFNAANTQTYAFAGVISDGGSVSDVVRFSSGNNNNAGTIVFRGTNTYHGTTTINTGILEAGTDVQPGVAGAFGISDTPVIFSTNVGGTAAASGLGIAGQFAFGRDLIVSVPATGQAINLLRSQSLNNAVFTGGVNIVSGANLAIEAISSATGVGGVFDIQGPITGGGTLQLGGSLTGIVRLSANSNGISTNTFSGQATLFLGRIQLAADSSFSGPASNPTVILSGPLGTGLVALGSMGTNTAGVANQTPGEIIEAVGSARTIVNPLVPMNTTADTTVTFAGHNGLTFTRGLDLNSDSTGTRNRTFSVTDTAGVVTFSGNITNSNSANLLKTGNGTLVLSGTNTQYNTSTTNSNYGTTVFVDAGVLSVSADTNLGAATVVSANGSGGAPHLAGSPTDIRMRAGVLQVTSGFTTARNLLWSPTTTGGSVTTGIDVLAGQTFTVTSATANATTGNGAPTSTTLVKTGAGTLALNNSANAGVNSLIIGGAPLATAYNQFSGVSGGVVSTNVTSGTPFGGGTVTINGGALFLDNHAGGSAQALTVSTVTFQGGSYIQLNENGTNGSALTATTLARSGQGTLTIVATSGIGSTFGGAAATSEDLITSSTFANTNGMLTSPTVVVKDGTTGDLNFVQYGGANGFAKNAATTTTDLSGAAATTSMADLTAATTVGTAAGQTVDIYAVRTNSSITPFDPTDILRINNGGLILNGTATTIGTNVTFGTSGGAAEALVYARAGNTSTLSGTLVATNFTKSGAGNLLISGAGNVLTHSSSALGLFQINEGTVQFGGQTSLPNNTASVITGNGLTNVGLVNIAPMDSGTFDLNGLNLAIAGLGGTATASIGTGMVINSGGSTNTLTIAANNQTTTFSGRISGNIALNFNGTGTQVLNNRNDYTGGTTVNAGNITSASGIYTPTGLLQVNSFGALGTSGITLAGGALAFAVTQTNNEVIANFPVIQIGPGNGNDVTVNATNNFGATNTTSVLQTGSSAASNGSGAYVAINNLNLNAPVLTVQQGHANDNYTDGIVVRGTTALAGDTTFNITANGNTIENLVLAGQLAGSSYNLTKIGGGTLTLAGTGGSANGTGGLANTAGSWNLLAGTVEARLSDGGANPLGTNTLVFNGGTLNIRHDGDNLGDPENITTFANTTIQVGSIIGVNNAGYLSSLAGGGGSYVSSVNSTINTDRLNAGSFKTIQVSQINFGGPLGTAFLTYSAGNSQTLEVLNGLTMIKDAYLSVGNDPMTIDRALSGNGTLVKSGGSELDINTVATNTGGTVIYQGTINFGSFQGNTRTLSNTAMLGPGNITVEPYTTIRFNATSNVNGSQTVDARSHLAGYALVGIGDNNAPSAYNLRVPQAMGVYNGNMLTATTTGAGVLAIDYSGDGTLANQGYTQALNLATIGDGTWFLGSMNNGAGINSTTSANGVYIASSLGVGRAGYDFGSSAQATTAGFAARNDAIYRLGGGGAFLNFGTPGNPTGASGVIVDAGPTGKASVVIGGPLMNNTNNAAVSAITAGTVFFNTPQSYSGYTLVNNGSTLEFRSAMSTSGYEVFGTIAAGGSAGTFGSLGATTHAGATIRLDNTLDLPASATTMVAGTTETIVDRWGDSTPVNLNSTTFRVVGNNNLDLIERVGTVNAASGFSVLTPQRAVNGRIMEINTPSIVRSAGAQLSIEGTSGNMLGTDERVTATTIANYSGTQVSPTSAITNGMVAPWMYNNRDTQFVTYSDFGFVNAGFNLTQAAATLASALGTGAERLQVTGAVVVPNAGAGNINVWALRSDASITLATAADSTSSITMGSGGLITGSSISVTPKVIFGSTGSPAEADIATTVSGNTLTIGDITNPATSGQITASNTLGIVKGGAGTLSLDVEQGSFSGPIYLNGGVLQIRTNATAGNSALFTATSTAGGNGGTIFVTALNGQINFRSDHSTTGVYGQSNGQELGAETFQNSITVAAGNPGVALNFDRAASTSLTNQGISISGSLTFQGSPGAQGQTVSVTTGNGMNGQGTGFNFWVNNGLNTGPAGNAIINLTNGNANNPSMTITGGIQGSGTLVRNGGSTGALYLGPNGVEPTAGKSSLTGDVVALVGTIQANALASNPSGTTFTVNAADSYLGSGNIVLAGGTVNVRVDSNPTTSVLMTGGATTNGSTTVQVAATAGLVAGMEITGPNIPAASYVTTITNSTQFVMNNAATATATALNVAALGEGAKTYNMPNNVVVTGNSTLNLDRIGSIQIYPNSSTTNASTTVTVNNGSTTGLLPGQVVTGTGIPTGSFVQSITSGTQFVLSQAATATAASNVAITATTPNSNNIVVFPSLTIGSQTLTVSSGDNYWAKFNAVTLTGTPTITANNDVTLAGVSDSGGKLFIVKNGGGTLWFNDASTTYAGDVYVNQGTLRFGNSLAGNSTNTIGGGNITINAQGSVRLENTTNILNGPVATKLQLNGINPSLAVLQFNGNTSVAALQSQITATSTKGDLRLTGAFANALNLALIGDGSFYLGSTGNQTYTANTLGVGAGNVYRLGANDGAASQFILAPSTATSKVLTGNASVVVGALPIGFNNGTGYTMFNTTNDYSGGTVVNRGSTAWLATGGANTPLGSGQVDVFGGLNIATANGTLENAGGTANNNTIVLHPGATMQFAGNSSWSGVATGNNANRWDDTTALALNGVGVSLISLNNTAATETVGALTFDRGSRLTLTTTGTPTTGTGTTLTVASFSRGTATNNATLVFLPAKTGSVFGTQGTVTDNFLVTGTFGPAVTNGMLPAYLINGTENTFVTEAAGTGGNVVKNATDTQSITGGSFTAGLTAGTDRVSVATAAATLNDNPVIYALRTNQNISNAPGQFNTITLNGTAGSPQAGGGLLVYANSTITPNLNFNGQEALIYIASGTTLTFSGDLQGVSATTGVTKFGGGTLNITKDQSDAARGTGNGYSNGWVVNEGQLTPAAFGALGNAVSTNTVTLQATTAAGGNATIAAATSLRLGLNQGNASIGYYSMGDLKVVDAGTISWDPGAADRVQALGAAGSLSNIAVTSTGGALSDAQLYVNGNQNRSLLLVNNLSLAGTNAGLQVNVTPLAGGNIPNNGLVTTGTSMGLSINTLVLSADQHLTKWGSGVLYIRGDSSASSAAAINIEEGAIQVSSNGSLGTGPVVVKRDGILDINTQNYTPTNSSITYQLGSIERWTSDRARDGQTLDLSGGATLQIANDQTNASLTTVKMNGGSIEGFIRTDDNLAGGARGVYRTLNSNVTFNLLGNSFLGQNITQGVNGSDNGIQPVAFVPIGDAFQGVILEIKGQITGAGGLTKQGYDTVTLSNGTNNYTGGTTVLQGVLQIGATNGISSVGDLTTQTIGVFNLNGYDQTVKGLNSPSTTLASNAVNNVSGFVTNTATVVNTLTIGNTVATVASNNATLNATTTVTLAAANTAIQVGQVVTGSGVAPGTTVATVSGTTVTLSAATSAGVTSSNLTFIPVNNYDGVIQYNVALAKTGAGLQILSNANTYVGATTVSGGVLRALDGTGLPAASNLTLNGGTYEVPTSATTTTFTRSLGTGAGQVQVTGGTSGFSANGTNPLTINLGVAGATLAWGSATFNPSTFVLNDATANQNTTLTNNVDLNANAGTNVTRGIAVNSGGSLTSTITGNLTQSGGTTAVANLDKTGPGTLVFSAGSTLGYTGTTTIDDGKVVTNAANQLPNTLLTVNSTAATTGVLDMNGKSQTVGGLAGTGSNALVTNSATSGAITLTVGDSTTRTDIFNGSITDNASGAVSLIKAGNTTQQFNSPSTYTGGTAINGGILMAANTTGSATGTAAVTVNSAAKLGGTGTVGDVHVASGGTVFAGLDVANVAKTGTLTGGAGTMDGNSTFVVKFQNGLGGLTQGTSGNVGSTVPTGGAWDTLTLNSLAIDATGAGDNTTKITIKITGNELNMPPSNGTADQLFAYRIMTITKPLSDPTSLTSVDNGSGQFVTHESSTPPSTWPTGIETSASLASRFNLDTSSFTFAPASGSTWQIGFETGTNNIDLFFAVPAPEPTALSLLALGALVLGRRSVRNKKKQER